MLTRRLVSSSLVLLVASACSGNSTFQRPTDSDFESEESANTSADSGAEAGILDAAADAQTPPEGTERSDADAPFPVNPGQVGELDAAAITVVQADAAPPPDAVCEFGIAGQLAVASELPAQAIPLSVTPDGKTWAYAVEVDYPADAGLAPDASASSATLSKLELHVASADDDFTVELPEDIDVNLGAALSADGNDLVTARENGLGFVLWQLDAESSGFEVAATQPFVRLNALVANGGVRLTHPAFSSSGTRLYAYELNPGRTPIQLVLRDGQWETEQRLTDPAFASLGFQITAATADDLTVFGWSSTEQRHLAWWRLTVDEPFHESMDLQRTVHAVDPECDTWWTLTATD